MNILVTLDRKYLPPLRVLLTSLFLSNPGERFTVYVISDDLTPELLAREHALCARFGAELILIPVPEDWFSAAPTLRYYSRAMYYRLLAAQLLPDDMARILYLDPDMLVINPLRPLYDTPLCDHLYAAAMHVGLVNLSGPVNKLRLSTEETRYYNSGMLLMNLPEIRRRVHAKDVFSYVEENRSVLVLPDQDVLNGLYGKYILEVNELMWNYDARLFSHYLIASQGAWTLQAVAEQTAILHFCGKKKPWNKAYAGRFTALYRHYMRLSQLYAPENP